MTAEGKMEATVADYREIATNVSQSREEAALSVRDLSVSFDGFKAVDGVSLDIEHCELRVVIGPNGAGKTTLLDMICGKTRPTSGSVQLNGVELTKLPDFEIVRRGVGRKFQNPSVYEGLTVEENLEISIPESRGAIASFLFKRDDRVRARIQEIAGEIYLDSQLQRRAGSLSHGQKQWLEIGMLLMQQPKLLLLDEPVAGMSPAEREKTAELLKIIAKGRAIVVIEHDMDFVRSIAHKVTVLHQGRLLAEGPADVVQADPRVIEVYLGH